MINVNQPAVKILQKQIKAVDQKLNAIICSDPQLNHLFNLVTSVSGVEPVLCFELLLTTKEFTSIKNPRKYASYAGVAPFDNLSGTSLKGAKRVSPMANKAVKKVLHMAALPVVSREGEMTDFYRRKVDEERIKWLQSMRSETKSSIVLLRALEKIRNMKKIIITHLDKA